MSFIVILLSFYFHLIIMLTISKIKLGFKNKIYILGKLHKFLFFILVLFIFFFYQYLYNFIYYIISI